MNDIGSLMNIYCLVMFALKLLGPQHICRSTGMGSAMTNCKGTCW